MGLAQAAYRPTGAKLHDPMTPALICILGPECTGKTTLARQLAHDLHGLWVPEELREFCDRHGRTPHQSEQLTILERQAQAEGVAQSRAQQQDLAFVFCDTAPMLTAVYSHFVFGDRSLYARAEALHARYALTLLMQPDIAWEADGLQRDGPQVRKPIQDLIVQALQTARAPYACIAGSGPLRVQAAKQAISSTSA